MTVAVGTGLVAGALALAVLLGGLQRKDRSAAIALDLLAWAGLAGLTAWLYAPYLTGVLVGAGDAYHYSLQVADYATQMRAGHFPVFVGQSAYAFNGNIHTLRTAPYFLHFAGALDFLTGERLTFPALLDLTILVHALAISFSAWRVAASLLGPANRPYAALLAALYALSPAVAGTVQAFDLVATFMALAWLPLFLRAVVALLDDELGRGTILGTWTLGVIWWAHPAIAAWTTAVWVATWGVVLVRRGRRAAPWLAALGSALGLALMTAYCFESVHSLHLGYNLGAAAEVRSSVVATVKGLWPAFIFHPLTDSARLLRPGYPLWIVGLVAGLAGRGRPWSRGVLLVMTLGLLLLLGAVPPLTPLFWSLVPNGVMQATNTWVIQRLAPLLAALLTVLGALGLRSLPPAPSGKRWLAGIGLAATLGWSLFAIGPERHAAALSTRTPVDSANALDPRNVYLTRSSYAMFGPSPAHFTNGRTAAIWETRLLDPQTRQVNLTNAEAAVAAAGRAGAAPAWQPLTATPRALPVDPRHGYVLEFSFIPAMEPGEIQLQSGSLYRSYLLPQSGGAAAFGSAAGNSRLIGFMPDEHDGQAIRVRSTVPGASVRAFAFAAESLPLRIDSLLPLRVRVGTSEPALLESPRVWVPGYRGTVDGSEVPVIASPEGNALLSVPPGTHEVEIRYAPPPRLRLAYAFSLFGLAGGLLLVVAGQAWRPGEEARAAACRRQKRLTDCLLAILLAAGAAVTLRTWSHHPLRTGAVHLAVMLPRQIPAQAEPLVVTGKTGAADVVFVRYLSGQRLQVGFDDWGTGGPVSPPIEYRPGQIVEIDVEYAALFADRASAPLRFRDFAHSPVIVRWNGQPVLDFTSPVHEAAGQEPAIGANAVGASSCAPLFTGEILEVSRFAPAEAGGK